MTKRIYGFLLFLFFILVSGCAHVISEDLRARVDPTLIFSEVLQNPNVYKDKMVLWGGEIIQVIPQKDETVLIEVLQRPFGFMEKPETSFASEGKFLILVKGYLDLSSFRKGGLVTIAGQIQGAVEGEKIKSLGDIDYRYPLVLSRQIYLWRDYYYLYPTHRYPRTPWWYDPSDRGLRF